ncbi:hypothetical protein DT075_22850 [Bacillus licheniformis]|nr:hypothetical protein DT075_22850 [Bacillus licheniformis]
MKSIFSGGGVGHMKPIVKQGLKEEKDNRAAVWRLEVDYELATLFKPSIVNVRKSSSVKRRLLIVFLLVQSVKILYHSRLFKQKITFRLAEFGESLGKHTIFRITLRMFEHCFL